MVLEASIHKSRLLVRHPILPSFNVVLAQKRKYQRILDSAGQDHALDQAPLDRLALGEKPVGGKTTVALQDFERSVFDQKRFDQAAIASNVLNELPDVFHCQKPLLNLCLVRFLGIAAHDRVNARIVRKESQI